MPQDKLLFLTPHRKNKSGSASARKLVRNFMTQNRQQAKTPSWLPKEFVPYVDERNHLG